MKRVFAVGLILLPALAHANWSLTTDMEAIGAHQRMDEDNTRVPMERSDGVLKLEEDLRYRKRWFTFSADPQFRALGSNWIGPTPLQRSIYSASIKAPKRGLPLETDLQTNGDTQEQASFERLEAGVKTENFELHAGRQAFSLGVLKFVPIWNRFSTNLPTPGLFLQFPTRDGISVRGQAGAWSAQAFSIFSPDPKTDDHLLENVLTLDGAEIRALVGSIEDELSAGIAMSTSLLNGTLRFEELSLGLRSRDQDHLNEWGFGYETALSVSTSVIAETFTLSDGATGKGQYRLSSLSSRRPLLAHDYLFSQVKVQVTSFLTIAPESFINVTDGSTISGLESTYSVNDNCDMTFKVLIPTGGRGDEFSTNATPLLSNGPAGMTRMVSVTLHLFF